MFCKYGTEDVIFGRKIQETYSFRLLFRVFLSLNVSVIMNMKQNKIKSLRLLFLEISSLCFYY